MGGGLRLYFEGVSYDDKGTLTGFGGRFPRGQFAVLLFSMRYDFSS
jgi:hypothetical protein